MNSLAKIAYIAIGVCCTTQVFGKECRSLTPVTRNAMTVYIQKQYASTLPAEILAVETNTVNCYTKVSFRIAKGRPFVFYLTPDHRFLASSLFEIATDPAITRQKEESEALATLSSGAAPVRGSPQARVVFVEFSDFECPYCRQVAELISKLPAEKAAKVRLIYRQMPLESHPWSRRASEVATCSYLVRSDAFWGLHDFIFKEQSALRPDNVESRLTSHATEKLGVDAGALNECLTNKEYVPILDKDKELAERYYVEGTPTLYVNGRLSLGFRTVEQLQKIIDEADSSYLNTARDASSPLPRTIGVKSRQMSHH